MKNIIVGLSIFLIAGALFAILVSAQTNNPPTHDNPFFNSTSGRGLDNDDLGCNAVNLTDPENDPLTLLYNYKVNNNSWSALEMSFEPTSQNVARDYSDHRNDGTYNGATLTHSIVHGYAAAFDGQNDYVEVPYSSSLSLSAPFTVEAWINASDLRPTMIILGRGNSTPTAINYALGIKEGRPAFGFTDRSLEGVSVASPEALAAREWYHIAGTYDRIRLALYVNGELKNTTSYIGPIMTDTGYLFVGGDVPSNRYYVNGLIDEARIYPRVLTREQLREHFNLRYNIVKAQETSINERWECALTPNDGHQDGATRISNPIGITDIGRNRLRINPPLRKTTINRTFFVDVNTSAVDQLFGVEFALRFDPALIESVNVTEGNFLRMNNVPTSMSFFINNTTGTIRFYNARLGGAYGGVNGTGILATVQFRMREVGWNTLDSTLELTRGLLIDVNNTPFVPDLFNGTILIRHFDGDVNNDNLVNIQDLGAVGIAFNSRPGGQFYNLDADLIEDRIIDIYDLSLVGLNLGRRPAGNGT